jgi:hypothetical protein
MTFFVPKPEQKYLGVCAPVMDGFAVFGVGVFAAVKAAAVRLGRGARF